MNDFDPDRTKAARVLQTLPPDAQWLSALRSDAPMRRIPDWLADAVFDARDTLIRDPIDFIAPEIARAHEALVVALRELGHEFASTFRPLGRTESDYTEVPPEWRGDDPDRYYEALRNLSAARQAVIDSYKELMNAMNRRGQLPPSPQDPTPGHGVHVTSGDNSPVNVYAPHANASHGATATASAGQPSAAPEQAPAPWWNRTIVLWTALGAAAAVAAVIVSVYK